MILTKSKIYEKEIFRDTKGFSEKFIKRKAVISSENKKIFLYLENKNNFLSSSEGNFLINYYIKNDKPEGIDFRNIFRKYVENCYYSNTLYYKNIKLFWYYSSKGYGCMLKNYYPVLDYCRHRLTYRGSYYMWFQ